MIETVDPNKCQTEAQFGRTPDQDLELWKQHASFGGEDKNRMVAIASWLLGGLAAILWRKSLGQRIYARGEHEHWRAFGLI